MERTQTIAQGTRVRVAFSGEGMETAAGLIAAAVEGECGAEGSAIVSQQGRWKGQIEAGYVIECVSDNAWDIDEMGRAGLLRSVGASLQALVKGTGLTFYVTAEQVLAMEVF